MLQGGGLLTQNKFFLFQFYFRMCDWLNTCTSGRDKKTDTHTYIKTETNRSDCKARRTWWNTRKPSCRWQTRATRKHTKNCSNSTCLHVQRCRWQYWSIFIRLTVGPSEICEIPRNSLKIQTYRVQGHPRSSILVPIEGACLPISY